MSEKLTNGGVATENISSAEQEAINKLQKLSGHMLELNPKIEPLKDKLGSDGDEFVGYIVTSHNRVADSLAKLFQESNGKENPLRDQKVRHDFRNIVGSSSGFAQLLLTETSDVECLDILSDVNDTALNFVSVLDSFR